MWASGNHTIRVVAINVRSIARRIDDLRNLEIQELCDVLCLVETWDAPSDMNLDIKNMRLATKDIRKSRGGGVIIYVREGLDFLGLATQAADGIEHAAIRIVSGGDQHEIHAIYRKPAGQTGVLLEKLEKILDNAAGAVTIVGDMNVDWLGTEGKHKKWRDDIGALALTNKMTEMTRRGLDRDSCIDHAYVTHDFVVDAKTEELHLADHRAVFIAIEDRVQTQHKKDEGRTILLTGEGPTALLRLHLRRIDWNALYVENGNLDRNFERFFDALEEKVQEFCVKKTKPKKQRPEWQDSEYDKEWKKLNREGRKVTKTGPGTEARQQAHKKYKAAKAAFQRLKRQKIYAHYRGKLAHADPKETWRLMNEVMHREKQAQAITKIEVDGEEITDPEEIANKLNAYYCNIGAALARKIDDTGESPEAGMREQQEIMETKELTADELKKAASKLKNKTSSSYDGLSNKLFKIILPEIIAPLARLINDTLSTGKIPRSIKKANAIYLKKKPQAKKLGDFRPISLVPVLMKIIDKIYCNRLNEHMEKYGLWAGEQHGYLKGKSTTTALLEVMLQVQKQVWAGKVTALILLDSSKAFDTVEPVTLLAKAKKYGVRGSNLGFMENYITGRSQVSMVGNAMSKEEEKIIGVPQGGNLSCLAFIMYNNDLPRKIGDAYIAMFSDDTSLVISADTAQDLERIANGVLKRVATWFATSKLTLNEEKSNYIIYGTKEPVNLRMTRAGLTKIEAGETTKLLGILLQPNGRYEEHAQKINGKLAGANFMLRQVSKKLPTHLKILIYRSLFESHLRYALPLWGPTLTLAQIKKIEIQQKKALRYVESKPYNAHTDPLFKKHKVLKFGDLIRIEMQLLMQSAWSGKLPGRLTNLITATTGGRDGLRAQSEGRVQRAARDPPLLNSLKATWNVLRTDQRQDIDRVALKAELQRTTLESYTTNCARLHCWDCQATEVDGSELRQLRIAQRELQPFEVRRIISGQSTYNDYGVV